MTAAAWTCACEGDDAMLSATADGNENVPDGYSHGLRAHKGAGLVIEQPVERRVHRDRDRASTPSTPWCTIPRTLDLSVVVPGVTTGFDVNSLLDPRWWNDLRQPRCGRCSGLVNDCTPDARRCRHDDRRQEHGLPATVMRDADAPRPMATRTCPTATRTVYVLTEGAGLVIEQLGAERLRCSP